MEARFFARQAMVERIREYKGEIDKLIVHYERMVSTARKLSKIPECKNEVKELVHEMTEMKQTIKKLLQKTDNLIQSHKDAGKTLL